MNMHRHLGRKKKEIQTSDLPHPSLLCIFLFHLIHLPTKVMAGGDGTPLYISNDGGLTWTQDTSAGLQKWSDIAVADDGTATALTDGGSIYTYVNLSEVLTQHSTDLPFSFSSSFLYLSLSPLISAITVCQ